jgi:hypothetical protein
MLANVTFFTLSMGLSLLVFSTQKDIQRIRRLLPARESQPPAPWCWNCGEPKARD